MPGAESSNAAALLESYQRQVEEWFVEYNTGDAGAPRATDLRHLRVPAGGDPRRRAARILSKCWTLLRTDA
jgi:hypothetical protein